MFFLYALFSDEPEVFLPKYSQTAINTSCCSLPEGSKIIQRSSVQFRGRSHTGVMDYDEACFMHLTPGVVHKLPKAVGV